MKIRAIVLEDNDSVRETLSIILKLRGYEVLAFPDPGACMAHLNHESESPEEHSCCDILITDVRMPGMTGLEYIESQKHHGCRVPNVAVMSGSWNETELEEARRLSCRVFEKPFLLEDLNAWLSQSEKKIDPHRELSVLPGFTDLSQERPAGAPTRDRERGAMARKSSFSQVPSFH
jgi:CheY-like chemotaxis protein